MSFELPELPYAPDALEPVIDKATMELHHGKHHAAYTSKLNDALKGTEWEDQPIEDILRQLDQLPDDKQTTVRQNGGGYYNHNLFWKIMGPSDQRGEPSEALETAIKDAFGSFDEMKKQFANAAASRFGSGWAWLCLAPDGKLSIHSTANQDTPFMSKAFGGFGSQYQPVLGLDVWEHAYYLKYQNRRPEYIEAWWDVVDWKAVGELFEKHRLLSVSAGA